MRFIPWFLALATAAFGADNLPYGHRDFCPSPERPIGWRGDGSGVFPGAYPVLEWDDPAVASPVRKSGDSEDVDIDKLQLEDGAAAKAVAGAASLGRNILWKVKLPDFGNGAPIVVGDPSLGPLLRQGSGGQAGRRPSTNSGQARVFVTADPDRLICLDATSGEILWQDFPCLDARKSNWGGSLGRSMPTPCSDGKFVFTKCTTGALICYDLEGAKKWSFPLANDNTEASIPSPVLVDGKVIVKETLGGKVFAVDAATGKSVWTVDLSAKKGAKERVAVNFDGYAVMRVGGRALLADSAGHVLDAGTGAMVADGLGRHGDRLDTWNGVMNCSIPGQGDVNLFAHMWRWGGFKAGHTAAYLNGSTRLYAYRFAKKAGGKGMGAELIWENNRDFWGTARGVTIIGEHCYWVSKNMDELTVIHMKTGDARTFPWIFGLWRHTAVYGSNPYGWIYPHCVSDGYFLYQQGGSGLMAVVLVGPHPRLVTINKTEKGIGGATLHGDRIYIHSRDHVYCIGDLEAEKAGGQFDEAERLASEGKDDQALAVLAELAKHPARHVRCRAVRRMLERHGAKSVQHVAVALEDTHEWVHGVAMEAARRLKDAQLAEAVAATLPSAKPRARATLLHMLAIRGETAAAASLLAGLADSEDAVREAALAAARCVGAAAVTRAIFAHYADAEDWERRHMFAALASMPGAEADAAIATALGSESRVVRADAAVLLGQRGATKCRQALFALRQDKDPVVRASAARAVRILAAAEDLDALLAWLADAPAREEEEELAAAAGRVLQQHSQPDAVVAKIQACWPNAKSARKRCLLVRVLGKRHTPLSLAALKGFLTPDVRADVAAAIGDELAGWSSADARPVLADLQKAGNPERARRTAYMGYVRNIALYEANADNRMALLAKAVPLAPCAADRRFAFDVCVRLQDVRGLRVITNAMAREMGGAEAVTAVTRLAPLTLEKAYAKTMSCVKDALSTVELLRGLTAEARVAQQEELKACLNRLQAIAAEKKLVTVADEADVADDINLGL